MDTRRSRGMLLAAGLLAIALASITGIAVAQSSDAPNPPRVDDVDDSGKTSSVTVPPGRADSEADEGTALQGLARITPDQAKAAAIAAVPGNATQVELDDDDGNVVYAVEVAGTDGKQTDLKIDAGNGAVLSRETETEGAEAGGDEPESSERGDEQEQLERNEQDDANETAEAPETDDD